GSFYYGRNDDIKKISIINNVEYINLWKDFPIYGYGSAINLDLNSNLIIKNVYSEGFYCISSCPLFAVNDSSKLEILNINMKNIHSNELGIIIHVDSNSSNNNQATIKGSNCTFTNIEQESSRDSALIWNSGGLVDLIEAIFENFKANHSSILYVYNSGYIYLQKTNFCNIYNKQTCNGILMESNVFIRGLNKENNVYLRKINIENYNVCINKSTECLKVQKELNNDKNTVFVWINEIYDFNLETLYMNNFNLYTMFISDIKSSINIISSVISNGYFQIGAINYSESNIPRKINIINSSFKYLYSYNSPVIQINYLSKLYNCNTLFKNVIFEEVVAQDRGGVIFSDSEYTNKIVTFDQCTFINTKAKYGKTLAIRNKYSI
ncbi:hypothetical protein BCR36DRAFT_306767, partial [Piromyces finnis]